MFISVSKSFRGVIFQNGGAGRHYSKLVLCFYCSGQCPGLPVVVIWPLLPVLSEKCWRINTLSYILQWLFKYKYKKIIEKAMKWQGSYHAAVDPVVVAVPLRSVWEIHTSMFCPCRHEHFDQRSDWPEIFCEVNPQCSAWQRGQNW